MAAVGRLHTLGVRREEGGAVVLGEEVRCQPTHGERLPVQAQHVRPEAGPLVRRVGGLPGVIQVTTGTNIGGRAWNTFFGKPLFNRTSDKRRT